MTETYHKTKNLLSIYTPKRCISSLIPMNLPTYFHFKSFIRPRSDFLHKYFLCNQLFLTDGDNIFTLSLLTLAAKVFFKKERNCSKFKIKFSLLDYFLFLFILNFGNIILNIICVSLLFLHRFQSGKNNVPPPNLSLSLSLSCSFSLSHYFQKDFCFFFDLVILKN